jgi:hypothetical protein
MLISLVAEPGGGPCQWRASMRGVRGTSQVFREAQTPQISSPSSVQMQLPSLTLLSHKPTAEAAQEPSSSNSALEQLH